MKRQYPSDITERQWRILKKLVPKRKPTGRPPLDRRVVLNAILYLDRTGLPMATAAGRLSELEVGLHRLLEVAERGDLAANSRCAARTNQAIGRKTQNAVGRHHRLAVGANRRRGPRAWLRCGKATKAADRSGRKKAEGGSFIKRSQTAHRRRYSRPAVDGGRHGGGHAGRERGGVRALSHAGIVHTAEGRLRRFGLRPTRVARMGLPKVRLDSANRPASRSHQGIRGSAQAMDRGTNLRLDRPLPPPFQRL